MAYYLTIKNKDQYEIVDITKSMTFYKESNFKQKGACSLKEIDIFTTTFDDQDELKRQLVNEKIINGEDFYKEITIRIKEKDTYKKVMYDLLYQDSITYLIDSELKKEILKRSYDYNFLDKFVKRFYDYYDCRVSIAELGNYVSDSRITGYRNKYLENRLTEVVNLLIYDYDKDIKYRNLHTIAAFITNYDKKNKEELKPKVKKKSNKNTPIPGQMSFF